VQDNPAEPPPLTARDVRQAAGFSGAPDAGPTEFRGQDDGPSVRYGADNGPREQQGAPTGRPTSAADLADRTRSAFANARSTEEARRAAGGGALPGVSSELATAKALLRGIFGGRQPAPTAEPSTEWRFGGAPAGGSNLSETASEAMSTARTSLAGAAAKFSRWVGQGAQQPAPHQASSPAAQAVPEEWGFSTGPVDGAAQRQPGSTYRC
jgi:hypothetical protein